MKSYSLDFYASLRLLLDKISVCYPVLVIFSARPS